MKSIILSLAFSFFCTAAFAQLQVSTDPNTSNHSDNQFDLETGEITIDNSKVAFAENAVSTDVSLSGLVATVGTEEISVFDYDGSELLTSEYDGIDEEGSLKIYALANGGFIVRENIANFLFYDSFGSVRNSISNSSQSTEGEAISELAADPNLKTVVLYNPVIVRNSQEGSRARVVNRDGGTTDIFNSNDRSIRFVNVSLNGQFITVVSEKNGTEDQVEIFDRFGNELNNFIFDQAITDVKVSEDGSFVTLSSSSRISVHITATGERIGSTSFTDPIRFADFSPEDQVIIALTADKRQNVLSNVTVHAISLEQRAVERKNYGSTLGASELIPVKLNRSSRFSYNIEGFSKKLNLRVSF